MKLIFQITSLMCAVSLLLCASPTPKAVKEDEAEQKKRIALTFDDGPSGRYTEDILDLLDEYGIKATFFVIGENVDKYPEIVADEIARGHEIGNHTYTHPENIGRMKCEVISVELERTAIAINNAADYRPRLFRPPGGGISDSVRQAASEHNYEIVKWNVDTRDWSNQTTEKQAYDAIMQNVKDGSIILNHDYVVRNDSITLKVLKRVIPELIGQGYEFVTVSELIGK